jgi:formamidopyrimidine-DNA glycosylase
MPELPEVETIVRGLRPQVAGRIIRNAELLWPRTLVTPEADKFARIIIGQKVRDVSRRAKFIILELSASSLFIHLRMSGDILIKDKPVQIEKHDRLILSLSNDKVMVFNDTRKFGRVWLTDDPEEVIGGLGPEPLSEAFTPEWLEQALQSRKRRLKPLLLDQTFIAGLGNIYTDEALHLARLHPLSASDSVTPEQAGRLWQAIREVLIEGIRRNGASIDWVYRGGDFQNFFRAYGRTGQPCPECGTPIERLLVGQRSTHICPVCQREEP